MNRGIYKLQKLIEEQLAEDVADDCVGGLGTTQQKRYEAEDLEEVVDKATEP